MVSRSSRDGGTICMTNPLLVEKCRTLRSKGFTLGEIIRTTQLPKTTVFDHIRDIPLPIAVQERIRKETIERLRKFSIKIGRKRKGKCFPGRIVPKPIGWTNKLLFLVAHFMFDGEIQSHSCIYQNRNEDLINRVKFLMKRIFGLEPRNYLNKKTGVRRISYHYVELADYIREKAKELKKYIRNAPLLEKKIFLQTFFDDEGCVSWRQRKKEVRGYQHNLEILRLIQKLLKDFNIKCRIDEKYKELVIRRKQNLMKFRDKINFSKGVFINPGRKNSIWKQKLEKREILQKIIHSYKK